jgi:glyoxylase-like metal-dependent hydrolase (beta-lactamase superfamily II)
VIAVATPGHTGDHLSVVVQDEGTTFFLAGDTSYDERLMLAGRIDGVSADDDTASATLGAIRLLAKDRPTVYLPTHDPESASRLASHRVVDGAGLVAAQMARTS